MRLSSGSRDTAKANTYAGVPTKQIVKLMYDREVNITDWNEGKKEAFKEHMRTYEITMQSAVMCMFVVYWIAVIQWIL